jgi:hypothetical protein
LSKAQQFFTDDHPQTAIAVIMELAKYVAPKDAYVIRCCAYQVWPHPGHPLIGFLIIAVIMELAE